MTSSVVARLAPSPTGALHLGNARTFLLAWLSARQQGGQVLLRIEDIDSPRVKPWATQSTIDDLRWLGLDWDPTPQSELAAFCSPSDGQTIQCSQTDLSEAPSFWIQTHRMPRYRQVLEQLIDADAVYRCYCSRSEVAQSASAPHESFATLEGPIYPGTCRPKREHQNEKTKQADNTNSRYAWRWAFKSGKIVWNDGVLGEQSAWPQQELGDFVASREDGTPAYQLAIVVDDHDAGITEIVRGDDLIFSTFRQLAILEHLGWDRPAYFHVPLLVGQDGKRLAKRHGDTRIAFFRQQGISSESLIGYLAWTANLLPAAQPVRPQDLVGLLDWSRLPKQPTIISENRFV